MQKCFDILLKKLYLNSSECLNRFPKKTKLSVNGPCQIQMLRVRSSDVKTGVNAYVCGQILNTSHLPQKPYMLTEFVSCDKDASHPVVKA